MILTVFKIHFSSHMKTLVKVPLIAVTDTGVQGLLAGEITVNGMIMASLAEMIQATFIKDSQTPQLLAVTFQMRREQPCPGLFLCAVQQTPLLRLLHGASSYKLKWDSYSRVNHPSQREGFSMYFISTAQWVQPVCKWEYVSVSPIVITQVSFSFNSLYILYTWSSD